MFGITSATIMSSGQLFGEWLLLFLAIFTTMGFFVRLIRFSKSLDTNEISGAIFITAFVDSLYIFTS